MCRGLMHTDREQRASASAAMPCGWDGGCASPACAEFTQRFNAASTHLLVECLTLPCTHLLCRRSLLSGAGDTLRRFMRLEAGANPLSPAAAGQGAAGDSPLSTHPAAANRLRRLAQMYGTAA